MTPGVPCSEKVLQEKNRHSNVQANKNSHAAS